MKLLKSINLALGDKLKDRTYRDSYFEEWAKDEVADQIKRLRKIRGLRQVDVAETTGMKQSAVSRIEKSEYSKWNFQTLLRLAQALDARVKFVFEPAEDVIRQYEIAERAVDAGLSANAFREKQEKEARQTSTRMAETAWALKAARANREQSKQEPRPLRRGQGARI